MNGAELIDGITYVLDQLEYLCLCDVQIDSDLHEVILKHCNRLKTLHLGDGSTDTIIGPTNDWLLRHYPTLDQIYIFKEQATASCPELLKSIELNPNIRSFGINSIFSEKSSLIPEIETEFRSINCYGKSRSKCRSQFDH